MGTYGSVGILQRVPPNSTVRRAILFWCSKFGNVRLGFRMTGKGLIASQESLRWQEWKGHYDSETHAPKDMPGLG